MQRGHSKQREQRSKSWSCDKVWDIRGATNALGDVSLSVSIRNSRVLAVTPKSQTQGTFKKNNPYLPVTLHFN